jgi:hypothetical protein
MGEQEKNAVAGFNGVRSFAIGVEKKKRRGMQSIQYK